MNSTKIYSVLSSFEPHELNRIHKFVNSPYFNQNKSLQTLFLILKQHIRKASETELFKEDIWIKIFAEENFNDTKFRKISSDLLKLVERYLALQVYENNPIHQANNLVEAVAERRLEKLYNTVMKSARRLSNRQVEKGASFYYYQYSLEKNNYDLQESEIKSEKRLNLEQIEHNLDVFYFAEKLRYYCTALSQKRVTDHEYEILFIQEILDHVREQGYEEIPQISIYYQIFLIYTDPEFVSHYYKLRKLIERFIDIFPQGEARDIYGAALNFCAQQINKGNSEFLLESFSLYKETLDNKLIYFKGELTPSTFRNIVFLSLRLKEFEWSREFIQKYSERLPIAYRENETIFAKARLAFHQSKFGAVLELLRDVIFTDTTLQLSTRALSAASFYELDEYDALHAFLSSFRTYLSRNSKRIPSYRLQNYHNLIKFILRLTKIQARDKENIEKLRADIEGTNQIADKKWLLNKLDELI